MKLQRNVSRNISNEKCVELALSISTNTYNINIPRGSLEFYHK